MEEILNLRSKIFLDCPLCDKCCEYRGDIKITPINVLEISSFLNITISDFLEKYTEDVIGEEPEIVIKGIGNKKECIFNNRENFKCKINDVKPMQCVVFPLVPINVKKDLFYNSNACVLKSEKKITVDKWLNGNNKIYKKHKKVYLEWIDLMNQIQVYWNILEKEKKDKIKNILFYEYDLSKNFQRQVLQNFSKVRKMIIDRYSFPK